MSEKDITIRSPCNTRLRPGPPPGLVANPGKTDSGRVPSNQTEAIGFGV